MREMRNSEIGEIGEIPTNWTVGKIKYVAVFYNGDRGKNYPSGADLVDEGIIFLTSNNIHGTEVDCSDHISKFITTERYEILGGAKIKRGDIIYCLRGSVGSCAINNMKNEGTVASSLVVIRPRNVVPQFLNYYLQSPANSLQVSVYMNGSCAANLSAENVANFYFIQPPITEQRRIADYLDAKCAEIDALTADIQEQIETLEQYKRSAVFTAVSQGIKPADLKMTESDVWTTIPANWSLVDIKYLFEIVKRIAGREGYDILSVTQKGIKVKDISGNEGQIAQDYSGYQLVYPTDYVMNQMDLLTGWVDCSTQFGVTSPDYRVFRLRDHLTNSLDYYKYVMQCCYMCRIFYSLGQGVSTLGRWRLQTSSFLNFQVPVPPLEEQIEIASFLDSSCGKIDGIIEEKQKQIEALTGYKKSLIYEYVTGKKEVPTQ